MRSVDLFAYLYLNGLSNGIVLCPWCYIVHIQPRNLISEKYDFRAEYKQNSIKTWNKTIMKDNWETSTQADRQNASDVWTPSDLLKLRDSLDMDDDTFVIMQSAIDASGKKVNCLQKLTSLRRKCGIEIFDMTQIVYRSASRGEDGFKGVRASLSEGVSVDLPLRLFFLCPSVHHSFIFKKSIFLSG